MTDIENPAGKVAGYTAQPDAKVALVNSFKEDEERLLRKIEALDAENMRLFNERMMSGATLSSDDEYPYDKELLDEAQSHLRIAFMLLNRAVFQPRRIKLPEDGE